MKKVLFLSLLLLVGCANEKPASIAIGDSITETVQAVEKNLTDDCATESVKTQLTAIKTQVSAMSRACEAEKETMQAEMNSWKLGVFVLAGLILLFLGLKIYKRLL